MKTKLKLVKIDVTHEWNKDFLKQLGSGKVYDYCLYDANQVTHCCEITPSYWLLDIYSETENCLNDVQYDEFVYHNCIGEGFYMHCAQVEQLEHIAELNEYDFKYHKGQKGESEYNEQFGDVEEDLRCNPVF